MNSDKVIEILNTIAECSQRTIKEEILGKSKDDPFFRQVLIAANDPFITYGVTGFPAGGSGTATFDELPSILTELSSRRLTGNAAAAAIEAYVRPLTADSQELFRRIITKDLRAGFTSGTCNRVEKGMIPVFEVMLAHKFEPKRIKAWPVAVEPKLDGVRVACVVSNHTVEGVAFLSRNGKPFPAVDHLKQPMLDFLARAEIDYPVFLDGEMVSGNFNKTVGKVRRKSVAAADIDFHIFDASLLVDFKAGASTPSYLRRAWINEMFEDQPDDIPFKLGEVVLAQSVEEIMDLYAGYRARGLEGAIVKPLDMPYVQKRSHAWLKVKNSETHDLFITGAFEGTGKYEGMLGGVIVDFNGVAVRVGGGLSDAQRVELWADYQNDITPGKGPFHLLLGKMIEVEAHEVTPDGSLRHPRFVRFRSDKEPIAKAA